MLRKPTEQTEDEQIQQNPLRLEAEEAKNLATYTTLEDFDTELGALIERMAAQK